MQSVHVGLLHISVSYPKIVVHATTNLFHRATLALPPPTDAATSLHRCLPASLPQACSPPLESIFLRAPLLLDSSSHIASRLAVALWRRLGDGTHPNARLRLNDDLLTNGLVQLDSFMLVFAPPIL
jgi:hypothetical protein